VTACCFESMHPKLMSVKNFFALGSIVGLGLGLAVFCPEAEAQQTSQLEDARFQVRKWKTHVDDLTDEIVSDSSAVGDWERSLYMALLASIWWKDDEARARTYLKIASVKLAEAWRTDDKLDFEPKVKFAQKTLSIISRLDPKAARSLTSEILRSVDQNKESSARENLPFADLLVRLGLQISKDNPDTALECGIDSLAFGISSSLPQLIAELYVADSGKGETLYLRTLSRVRGNYSNGSLLFYSNFEKFLFEIPSARAFSASIRQSFLVAYSELVISATPFEHERPVRCKVANYAGRIAIRIDEHLPEQAVAFRQSLALCLPYISSSFQGLAEADTQSSESPKTVEDFLQAAKTTKDKILKLRYWREALAKLERDKKYLEIISFLDSTDGDLLKQQFPIVWDDWRIDAAYQAVLIVLDVKDLPGAYRIVERTPKRIRPPVRMRIANKFKSEKPSQFYSDNLDEIVKEIESLEIAPKDAANFYKKLAELYLTVRPTEAEGMFANSVKYINKADSENPEYSIEKDWAPRQDYVALSSTLLEIDATNIAISLNKISSRRSRVRLKLGLLESSLKKLASVTMSLEQILKSQKKSAAKL
jgi:hypothetical protein